MNAYGTLSKEQLIAEIKRLKKGKEFGLLWKDKPEDVAELCKTKLPVFVDVEDKEISDGLHDPMNILIEGENYQALSVLNYTHKGKIDFIYIDPPYNTGNGDFRYNDKREVDHKLKSIMQPFFYNETSAIEMAFINFLEKQGRIHWWFKNGDRDAVYLAVPYQENGDKKPFYVDFIVQMKDGSTGLFDTKSGLTRQVAGPKVDGLRAYIKEQNRKGKNL